MPNPEFNKPVPYDQIDTGKLFVVRHDDTLYLKSERGQVGLYPFPADPQLHEIYMAAGDTFVHDGLTEVVYDGVSVQPRRHDGVLAGWLYRVDGGWHLGVRTVPEVHARCVLVDVASGALQVIMHASFDAGAVAHWWVRRVSDGKALFSYGP